MLGPGQFSVIVRPRRTARHGKPTLSPAVAVFISAETDRAQSPPSGDLRKLFDLTRKEAELAMCLTNGRSLREAAADLGITLNTARAHLRSIFAKTGIDRQAQLLRAILRSVAALVEEHPAHACAITLTFLSKKMTFTRSRCPCAFHARHRDRAGGRVGPGSHRQNRRLETDHRHGAARRNGYPDRAGSGRL